MTRIAFVAPIVVAACARHPAAPSSAPSVTGTSNEHAAFVWTEPSCFSYSPTEHAFACLDFSLSADTLSEGASEPTDFERYRPIPGVAWQGHESIALVAATTTQTIDLARKEYDDETPIVRSLDEASARSLLARRDYRISVRSVPLSAKGTWEHVGRGWLRFETVHRVGETKD